MGDRLDWCLGGCSGSFSSDGKINYSPPKGLAKQKEGGEWGGAAWLRSLQNELDRVSLEEGWQLGMEGFSGSKTRTEETEGQVIHKTRF